MKVIQDLFNVIPAANEQEHEETCEHCGSSVLVTESDLIEGQLGMLYFECPCCNRTSETDLSIDLSKENIKFPQHFFHFSGTGAKIVSEKEIQQMVKDCLNRMWEDTNNSDFVSSSRGDTIVIVENLSGEGIYNIIVAKNYYEAQVACNPEDKYYKERIK